MNHVKISIILIALFTARNLTSITFNQQYNFSQESKLLVGSWKFIHLLNSEGEITKKIYNERLGATEFINRPSLKFKQNGEYESKYPFGKLQHGKWEYIEEEKKIIYHLFIDSTDFVGQDLIEKGIANKYEDGSYYQKMEQKIISVDNKELVILEQPDKKLIYNKE